MAELSSAGGQLSICLLQLWDTAPSGRHIDNRWQALNNRPMPDPLSLFWAPVCAIGSHGAAGPNAQICVSVFGASVTPERPRLLVTLWKDNFTHDLVAASKTLVITVLSEPLAGLVPRLGLVSGRSQGKLAGTRFELTLRGDPYFPGGAAVADCDVLRAFDLGDATSFLVAVRERRWLSDSPMLSRARMHELLGGDFAERWEEKLRRSLPGYREAMAWG